MSISENIPGGGALFGIQEELRRERALDDKYYRDLLYFFEMLVPEDIGGGETSFLMPLVLNPEEYSISEPFSASVVPTTAAGLYAEEDGIIQREIRIRGHTGFKPRRYFGSNFGGLKSTTNGPSFTRKQALGNMVGIEGVSGQRHFQFLQDALRTYGDLKQDPATAKETALNFHVMKDDEHWRVVPRKFDLRRRNRVLYGYEIDLLVVGPAAVRGLNRPEDKDIIDAIKDAFRMIKSAIDTVNGIIQDVTAMIDSIRRFIADIGKILSSITDIIDNAADFVSGAASAIAAPFAAVTSVISDLDTALGKMEAAGDSFPDTITNSFRKMQDSFHRIGAHPEVFVTKASAALYAIQAAAELSTSRTKDQLSAAAAGTAPTTFKQQEQLGTGNTVGDQLKARGELGVGRSLLQYRSAKDYELGQGDSLPTLAARHLGDARLWRQIAVLNGLKEPYISASGLPHTKKVGDKILIPSTAPPPDNRVKTPVVGVAPTIEPRERILGRDIALEAVDGGLYDIPIDVEGGSVDVKTVAGVSNLRQALVTRLSTERGRDPLYQNMGLDRVVAIRIPAIDQELIRFRIAQAIEDDPRITSVRALQLSTVASSPDTVEVDIEAEVTGLTNEASLTLQGRF